MNNFRVTCKCGHYITRNDDLYKLSYYKLRQPVQKRTSKNERIIEETFYYYVCPKCERDVIVIKRKAINAVGNIKILIPEKIIGKKATDYLLLTEKNRINKTNELRYGENNIYVRGVPLSYFKTLGAETQRPRYINEVAYSGSKVESKVKVFN